MRQTRTRPAPNHQAVQKLVVCPPSQNKGVAKLKPHFKLISNGPSCHDHTTIFYCSSAPQNLGSKQLALRVLSYVIISGNIVLFFIQLSQASPRVLKSVVLPSSIAIATVFSTLFWHPCNQMRGLIIKLLSLVTLCPETPVWPLRHLKITGVTRVLHVETENTV